MAATLPGTLRAGKFCIATGPPGSATDVTFEEPSRRGGARPQPIRKPPQIIQFINIELQTRVSKDSSTCAASLRLGQMTGETIRPEVRRKENGR